MAANETPAWDSEKKIDCHVLFGDAQGGRVYVRYRPTPRQSRGNTCWRPVEHIELKP